MAVVSLKIGGRSYKFSCNDGQEEHMRMLADSLDKRAEQLMKTLGFMQEGQLLAMLCLLLAQDKFRLEKAAKDEGVEDMLSQMAEHVDILSGKITALAETLDA